MLHRRFAPRSRLSPAAFGADAKPEKTDVKIAVGGKSFMIYLPLTLTERLGYFKDAGIERRDHRLRRRHEEPAGAHRAAMSMPPPGSFDHTIQMQAKGQPIVAVVETGRYPGIVLGLVTSKKLNYHSPKDLKGLKIGVTAPGSQTNFMVNYILTKNGMKPEDVSLSALAARRRLWPRSRRARSTHCHMPIRRSRMVECRVN